MKKLFLGMLGISLALSSCSNDDESTNKNLNLNISGLEDLGATAVYEGWIIVDGSPITTGRFTVNSTGQLSKTSFTVNKTSLQNATTFVLTIEPAVNDDPAPSDIHILAADFNGDSGSLSVSHPAALNSTFSDSAGKYILATPTDGDMMSNEESGIWFLDNSTGSAVAGLTLPTLPSGWKYEGWTVINGTAISTGTFLSNSGSDSSGLFSGMNSSPSFPGEDFLVNAPTGLTFPTDIRGGKAVVSIEPFPDNSPAPFLLKPLVHDIPANAATHSVLTMGQNLSSFPSGTIAR